MINWIKTLFKIVREYNKAMADVNQALHETMSGQTRLHAAAIDHAGKVQQEFMSHYGSMQNRMAHLDALVRERTEIHADVTGKPGRHDAQYAVMIGRYKNRDFVQVFNLSDSDFRSLVERFMRMNRHARIGRIDAPYGLKEVVVSEVNYRG